MPAIATSLPRRPTEKFGPSDGSGGRAGAPASNTEPCDWLTIPRLKYGASLLPAVCGAGGVGFQEAMPAGKFKKSPLPDASELSGSPKIDGGSGDGNIGVPLKIPCIGAGSGGGVG
jgi:hypothetical protein